MVRSSHSPRIFASRGRNGSAVRTGLALRRRAEGILFEDSDSSCDVDGRRGPIGFAADREAAHLALDASFVAAMGAGWDALFEDFVENRSMQRRPVPRGKRRRRTATCGAPLGPRAGRIADRGPRRPATRL